MNRGDVGSRRSWATTERYWREGDIGIHPGTVENGPLNVVRELPRGTEGGKNQVDSETPTEWVDSSFGPF